MEDCAVDVVRKGQASRGLKFATLVGHDAPPHIVKVQHLRPLWLLLVTAPAEWLALLPAGLAFDDVRVNLQAAARNGVREMPSSVR